MVWIQFLGLSLLFYNESMLLTMATTIGTLIKIDTNTLNITRGKFVRVCIEVDLIKTSGELSMARGY